MGKWKMVKWNQVLQIKNGKNQKAVESSSGIYPIYGSGGIMGYANDYICPEKTTIIGRKGSINNPIYVEQKFWNVDTAFGLVANSNLDSKFLYYFCVQYNFQRHNKAVTLPSLTKIDLLQIFMPLPPLEEQRRIAQNLDLASEIIKGYKKQLAELDKLVQSVFYEMFGDPVTNEKGWKTKYIDELYEIIDGDRGTNYPKQEEFSDEGYCLFLNAGNVTKKGFVFENVQFITRSKDKLLRKGKLQRDDIVLTTRGTVGNLAHYTENILFDNVRINSGMVILRRFAEIEHNYFLAYFSNPLIYTSLMSGSAQPQLPITNMRRAKVVYPPLPLQTRFASIVTEIEAQKAQIQKGLSEAENLFNSLMQEYFE